MEGDELGLCSRITYGIKTLTDDPVVSQPYRVPKALEPEVQKIVQKMSYQNFIRKIRSDYSSPVALVEKSDKSLRFCKNCQELNIISNRRTFQLPNPDVLLARVGSNRPKWFSSSDLAAAPHQVPIKEDERPRTAFVLPWVKYDFLVLSMGLTKSPQTFAR